MECVFTTPLTEGHPGSGGVLSKWKELARLEERVLRESLAAPHFFHPPTQPWLPPSLALASRGCGGLCVACSFPLSLSMRCKTQVWGTSECASIPRSPPTVALAAIVTVAKQAAMEMLDNVDVLQNSRGILFCLSISIQNSSAPQGHRTILVER